MESAAFWHRWAFGGLLVIVEALAPGYMFLWFGVAAGLVGLFLVIWPALGLSFQLLIYPACWFSAPSAGAGISACEPVVTDQPDLNRRGAQYVGRRLAWSGTDRQRSRPHRGRRQQLGGRGPRAAGRSDRRGHRRRRCRAAGAARDARARAAGPARASVLGQSPKETKSPLRITSGVRSSIEICYTS